MGLNHDKLKQRRAGARGGGWKAKVGENRVRILPPHSRYLTDWDDLDNFAVSYKMHYFKIEGKPTEVSLCLDELKQRCPACDMWRAHRKSEDPGLVKMAEEISPADTYLFNILDLNNLQAGIQKWSANWTCWDAIMEIGGNHAYGNVVDPANGVDFLITLTSGDQTKSGYNKYSALPLPDRSNVMPVLDPIADWRNQLDSLVDQMTGDKKPAEIVALLTELGFPPPEEGGAATVAAVPAVAPATPPAEAVGTPVPVESSGPVAIAAPGVALPGVALPGVGPVAVAGAAPVAVEVPGAGAVPVVVGAATPIEVVAPTIAEADKSEPEAPLAVGPAVVPVSAGPAAAATGEVHYDPGPDYVSEYTGNVPAGAPKCFGEYDPVKHRCPPCPMQTPCQIAILNVDE